MSVTRSFGIQSIASSASQPLFGTTLGDNGTLTPDQFSGNTKPGSNPSLSYLPVTNSAGFRIGDLVAVAPKNKFQVPATAAPAPPDLIDTGFIKNIEVGSPYDIVTVQGLLRSHASGEYFVLNEPANTVKIVPRVTTGLLYVGSDSSVAANAISTFDVIPIYNGTGAVPYFHETRLGDRANPFQLLAYWLLGTANDTFVAYWTEV